MPRKKTVTKVIDGDTLETSRRKHPVRLATAELLAAGHDDCLPLVLDDVFTHPGTDNPSP